MTNLNAILIVDGDKQSRLTMRTGLDKYNFFILESTSGKRAIEILQRHDINAIILNLHLSDGYALDYIEIIKKHTNAPLIIVSSEININKTLASYACGADDFVQMPCNQDILSAKIRSHIRRYSVTQSSLSNALYKNKSQLKFMKWIIKPEKFQVFDEQGHSADLTIQEFHVLYFLINNTNRAITRRELCECIRNENYVPTDRAIDIKIARIRKKIDNANSDFTAIQTVRGIGYLFNKQTIIH